MSQTPPPQSLVETTEDRASALSAHPRKRSHPSSSRPVSAFAPGMAARSEVVATETALVDDDLRFVAALHGAGVASELTDAELERTGRYVRASDPATRRIELLSAYYEPDDPLAAQRRRATDRWFLFSAEDGLNARELLGRLLVVVPELIGSELERVGGADGTLVLRAGDDVCALEDELEVEPGMCTVSVSDLVRAVNVLLDRRTVRARLVGLIGDGTREAYLGLPSVTAAIGLSSGDYLAAIDAEALLDLTGW